MGENRPIRTVLSLDGGGSHCMMTVHFLAELEARLGHPLREVFDAVAGTSLGAMLAASLFYNTEMTAERAKNEAFSLINAQRMMDINLLSSPVLQTLPKYKGEVKRELIDKYVPDLSIGEPPRKNLVFIPAYDVSRGVSVVFKSYDRDSPLIDVPVRDCADASSAAPTFFPSVRIHNSKPHGVGGTTTDFAVDGGLAMNNPCDSLYADLIREWKDCDVRILSVGAGVRPKVPVGNPEIKRVPWSNPFAFFSRRHRKPEVVELAGASTQHWGGVQWMTEGNLVETGFSAPMEAVHYRMKRLTEVMGHQYVRVNMPLGRQRALDDVSDENLRELATLGKEAGKKFGDVCVGLLQPRVDELKAGTAWTRADFQYQGAPDREDDVA